MSQDWDNDIYNYYRTGHQTFQNMEKMFETLRTSFSGDSSPTNAINGLIWFALTDQSLRLYNDGWMGIMQGTSAQIIFIYRSSTDEGWVVQSGAADVVLAISSNPGVEIDPTDPPNYITPGGTLGGSWDYPTHKHGPGSLKTGESNQYTPLAAGGTYQRLRSSQNHKHLLKGKSGDSSAVSNWRPAAAIGTLQKLDIS